MRRLLPLCCSELHGPRAGRTGQEAGAPGLRRRRPRCLSFWRLETHCAPPPAGAGFARTGRRRRLRGRGGGRGGAGRDLRARLGWGVRGGRGSGRGRRGRGVWARPQQLRAESQLRHLFSSAFQRLSQAPAGGGVGGVDGPPEERPRGCLVCLVALLWSGLEFLHF